MSVHIITDSGCDILPDEALRLGVEVLPLKTYFGETEYLDGVTIDHDTFFQLLIETDLFPKTSQLTPYEYEEKFKEIQNAGDTAVCITLSSKLSGCYQSALLAAQDFEGCIYVVDSENATVGQRLLVELALRLKNEGKSAAEISEVLEVQKKKVRLIALLDTLEYLKKGGRISAATALAGTLLSIKPVVAVEKGEVVLLGQARGSKNGNNKLNEFVTRSGEIAFDLPYSLAYSGLSDALLQKYIRDSAALYEGHTDNLPCCTIGSAIGTHVGPGAIAASFFVK